MPERWFSSHNQSRFALCFGRASLYVYDAKPYQEEEMMKRICLALVLFFPWGGACLGGDARPLLLQSPTLSKTQIAFAYGGDIWIVDRNGGDTRRLVIVTGLASSPLFSPDGTLVAYTGDYDGNQDVYVVAAAGGGSAGMTRVG
jgi:tricorn protease-like protein